MCGTRGREFSVYVAARICVSLARGGANGNAAWRLCRSVVSWSPVIPERRDARGRVASSATASGARGPSRSRSRHSGVECSRVGVRPVPFALQYNSILGFSVPSPSTRVYTVSVPTKYDTWSFVDRTRPAESRNNLVNVNTHVIVSSDVSSGDFSIRSERTAAWPR